tara:strand:+ start:1552 stop:2877 length:1326 start_codon:yes stop_codon:yes gene_type:complete
MYIIIICLLIIFIYLFIKYNFKSYKKNVKSEYKINLDEDIKNQLNKDFNNKSNQEINIKNNISKTYYKCNNLKNNKTTSIVLKKLNIERIFNKDNADVFLPCGYNYVEVELYKIKPKTTNQIIFGINGCDKICSKKTIWKILNEKYPINLCNKIMPMTYIIKNKKHMRKFKEYNMKNYKSNDINNINNINNINSNIYILKNNLQRKKGLYLSKDYKDVLLKIKSGNYKIIQEYIKDAYTINNHKLNIRMYVSVICYQDKSIWLLYENGKCIYTNKEYNEKSLYKNNIIDKEQHFTSYNFNTNLYEDKKLPESLDDLNNYLGKEKYDKLIQKIIYKLNFIRKAFINKLCKNEGLYNNICFQLFGIDIILKENNLEPLILEFNKGPNLDFISPNDENMKTNMLENLFKLIIFNKDIKEDINNKLINSNTKKINNWYIINNGFI